MDLTNLSIQDLQALRNSGKLPQDMYAQEIARRAVPVRPIAPPPAQLPSPSAPPQQSGGFLDAVKSQFNQFAQDTKTMGPTVAFNRRLDEGIKTYVPEQYQEAASAAKDFIVPQSDVESAMMLAGPVGAVAGRVGKVARAVKQGLGVANKAGTVVNSSQPNPQVKTFEFENLGSPDRTVIQNNPQFDKYNTRLSTEMGQVRQGITPEQLAQSRQQAVPVTFQPSQVEGKNRLPEMALPQRQEVQPAPAPAPKPSTAPSREGREFAQTLSATVDPNLNKGQSSADYVKRQTGVDLKEMGIPSKREDVAKWYGSLDSDSKERVNSALSRIKEFQAKQNEPAYGLPLKGE